MADEIETLKRELDQCKDDIETLKRELDQCKDELQVFRDKEMNEKNKEERLKIVKGHDIYDCKNLLFRERMRGDISPQHGSCIICDEKMKYFCLDGEKIKDDVENFLLSLKGVDSVTTGRAVMNYGGYDNRLYIVVYHLPNSRCKFIDEEIERSHYSFLGPYITYE